MISQSFQNQNKQNQRLDDLVFTVEVFNGAKKNYFALVVEE